jgi:hypothetical protein
LLERLVRYSGALALPRHVERFELYHRASTAVRVVRCGSSDRNEVRVGGEDGVAARLQLRGEPLVRFAATSGGRESSLRASIERAADGSGSAPALPEEWIDPGERRIDRDPDARLPSPAWLAIWLEGALAALSPEKASVAYDEAWVEVASTVESWVLDRKPCASRARTRGWALLRLKSQPAEPRSPRPLVLAARSWRNLSRGGWAELQEARQLPEGASLGGPERRLPVLFSPETSALLVQALVRAIHGDRRSSPLEVGPGWRVDDAPDDTEALFGGDFDDIGADAHCLTLADGSTVTGRIHGAGHLRRPSFRDPPRSSPSHLRVEPLETVRAGDALRVSRLSLHPLPSGQWILDIDGALLSGGAPGPVAAGVMISTTPEELVRKCVAGCGTAVLSHRGVRTPALLFDGLRVRC